MKAIFAQAFATVSALLDRFTDLKGLPNEDWRGLDLKELSEYLRLREAESRNDCHDIITNMIRSTVATAQPSPLHAYFLACRCRCALDTMMILATPKQELSKSIIAPKLPPDWTQDDLLEWLLVGTWDMRHDVWMKLTAFAIKSGNPFYSG